MPRAARPTAFVLVTPLLLVSVAITALLALQAHGSFVYHRATAERVMRDFAGLAAGEMVRRSTAQIGYDGYLPLLSALAQAARPEGLPADLPARLAADPDARVRRAAALARRLFVAAPGGSTAAPGAARIAFAGEAPPAAAEAVLALLAGRAAPDSPFAVAHGGSARSPLCVAFARAPAAPWELVGFEVEPDQLRSWYAAAFERAPLVPASIGGGKVTNASLSVAVRDRWGVERFRAGGGPWPRFAVEAPFGTAYAGILDGSSVRVSIDPEAARHLVIGGVPRSRTGLLLGLLGLSTALVFTAALQLRRERALQHLRSEFVASISHELRTPLTQIRMFAETLLLGRVRSEEERQRALEIVDREARRLSHLVENVLLVSRGERGTLTLAPLTVPLAPLVREVLEQHQPLIAGTGVRLTARLDETVAAHVDADALRQVLLNLLDNAVKYGPREQEVVVGLERAPGAARLSVDDQGPGVPAAERRRIFERFHRLERHRQSALAGAGIGLAVVKDLVERHGGRCSVEEGTRGGARFVVELPGGEP